MSPDKETVGARKCHRSSQTTLAGASPAAEPTPVRGSLPMQRDFTSPSLGRPFSDERKRMLKAKILLVDQEKDLRELVRYILVKEGYRVHCAATGEDALAALEEDRPDLVVLEATLPGVHGLDVCRYAKGRAATAHIPVIMVSSSAEEADVIAGLDSGADDYMAKPFGVGVLLARIRAALRGRGNHLPHEKTLIEIGDVIIDPARHRVIHKGKAVTLTVHQFDILYYLATRPGVVCSREEIITAVKGDDYPVTERSVDVQIVALRKKLCHAGGLIETVRGVGYRISSSYGLQDS